MLGAVVVVSLGPDIEVAGQRMGSFAAGLWDRPVVTGHFGEQAGYQLNLDLLSAGRLLGVPMSELANRLVRLEDLLGPIAAELVERMALAPDAASRHRLARGLIVRRLAEPSRFSPRSSGRSRGSAPPAALSASRRSRHGSAAAGATSPRPSMSRSGSPPRQSRALCVASTPCPSCGPASRCQRSPTRPATQTNRTSTGISATSWAARPQTSHSSKTGWPRPDRLAA